MIVNCYWCPLIFKCPMSHGTVCDLYSLHPDFITLENIINIETKWVTFFNNWPTILKLIVRVRKYHILINMQKKKCWFENWIFKNFFLEIYRSQTNYSNFSTVSAFGVYVSQLIRPILELMVHIRMSSSEGCC